MNRIDQGNTCTYGARLMLGYLNSFHSQIDGGLKAEDIEFVHQLRVYSRRLRCALPIFFSCVPKKDAKKWQKQIRKITRALGEARDLDVQVEALFKYKANLTEKKYEQGIQRMILRLSQRRSLIQGKVYETLKQLTTDNNLREMQRQLHSLSNMEETIPRWSLDLYGLARDSISQNLDILMRFDEFVYDPQYVRELHKMRIAAKGLRYTIEIFAPIYPSKLKIPYKTIRQAQEMLGKIHDCDVWIDFLPRFKEEEKQRISDFYGSISPYNFILPGLNHFEENRHRIRKNTYEKFRTAWTDWKKKCIWEDLIDTVESTSFLNGFTVSALSG